MQDAPEVWVAREREGIVARDACEGITGKVSVGGLVPNARVEQEPDFFRDRAGIKEVMEGLGGRGA